MGHIRLDPHPTLVSLPPHEQESMDVAARRTAGRKPLTLDDEAIALARHARTWRVNACVYTRRMPRMQVYLPAELYEIVKQRRLPASELLQEAVRSEVRRRKLQSASRRYTTELAAEVGQPAPRERARAVAVAQRIAARTNRKAG